MVISLLFCYFVKMFYELQKRKKEAGDYTDQSSSIMLSPDSTPRIA